MSVKHLKIFQFQDMHFMGIGPDGGRCRQVQKKTTIVINKIFYIILFENNIKTNFLKSQNGWWRKETKMIDAELQRRCLF